MKRSIITLITLMLLCAFAASIAHAQGNCCQIQVSGVTVNMTTTKVSGPPSGTYISTQTNSYNIACANSQTGKACDIATNPTNAVTAAGSYGSYNGSFAR